MSVYPPPAQSSMTYVDPVIDPSAERRWREAVQQVAAESYPVPAVDGWGYVSAAAHKLFWELGPERVCIEEDSDIFNVRSDIWPALHGYTLEAFEAGLIELEDAGAITFDDGLGEQADGTPARLYIIHFPGVEQVYLKNIQAEHALPDIFVGTESKRNSKRSSKAQLVDRFDATCVYCKKVGTPELGPDGRTWHGDHVWAKAQGGRGNIVLACMTCNIRKHQLSAQDFLEKLADEASRAS